ncbi:MAG: SH3 domain-containing protein [Spirochaetes bacterium]|nr:SH3 domain-containing protein [Spirochaetota bacterium]
MKKIILLMMFIISISINAYSEFSEGSKVYITVSKLNYRSEPDVNGKLLGQLKLAEEITIMEKSPDTSVVGDTENYWYRFKAGKKTGWVFGAFLTNEKIPDIKEIIIRLKGTYYYYDLKSNSNYERILKISDSSYVERFYNDYTGITDEITGNVIYQADSIILKPLSRKVRPSVYIDNPRNKQESEAYRNAYFGWGSDPAYLTNLSRFKPEKTEIKLFVKYNSKGKIYLLETNSSIDESDYAYSK